MGRVNSVSTGPGVWYTLVGSGETLGISVNAEYDSQITVYIGEDCETLVCIDGNDQSLLGGSTTSGLLVSSNTDETLYVLVHGFGSSKGSFSIHVDVAEFPENDICSAATEILADGILVSGDTTLASLDEGLTYCGT